MNFFTEIAPCCNNSLIYGAFRAGVASGDLNVRIEYTFTYRVAPTNVILH
ncbi:MAG TPA: photoactive yellow protein, partial [Myxococcales bacterium]|nr:photoactive yellow protein [Myxococcales bacterium]